MKRLEALKQEKEELARQVEVEEEMITNALTKKLQKVKEEKVHLENQLEQEQEYIVNKLQKQLSTVLEEKRVLELRLRENTGAILQSIQQHLARWTASSASKPPGSPAALPPAASPSAASAPTAAEADLPAPPSSPVHSSLPGLHLPSHSPVPPHSPAHNSTPAAHPLEWSSGSAAAETSDEMQRTHFLVSHLTREIDQLGTQHERFKKECEEHRSGNEKLRAELSRLQHENAGLCHRVTREREIRAAAIVDRARLETSIELDSERAFNSCSNRSSVSSSPALSASVTSLPPTWALPTVNGLPSPRGLTPSLLTPSVISSSSLMGASQQLSPIRAPSPKNLPLTPGGTPTHAPSAALSPKDSPSERRRDVQQRLAAASPQSS